LRSENEALRNKLKSKTQWLKRGSLRLALTLLAKDLNALTCNQDSTEKGNKNVRETTEDPPWELVEVKKEKITQGSHSKEEDDLKPLLNLNSHVQIQTPIK